MWWEWTPWYVKHLLVQLTTQPFLAVLAVVYLFVYASFPLVLHAYMLWPHAAHIVSLLVWPGRQDCMVNKCGLARFRETNTYIKAVYELSDLVNMRIRVFPYHSDLIFYLSPHGFRFRRACRVTHRHTGTESASSLVLDQSIQFHALSPSIQGYSPSGHLGIASSSAFSFPSCVALRTKMAARWIRAFKP